MYVTQQVQYFILSLVRYMNIKLIINVFNNFYFFSVRFVRVVVKVAVLAGACDCTCIAAN